MEKKEIKEWLADKIGDLMTLYDQYLDESTIYCGADFYGAKVYKYKEREMTDFISQELDKAREEGMFTEDEQRVLRFALKLQRDDIHKVWDEETFGTIWKKVGGLSKLTTK